MEIWGTCREPAQDRPFDLSDVIEVAIDQSLAEVRRGFAGAGCQSCVRICFAYRDSRQIGDVQSSQIRG